MAKKYSIIYQCYVNLTDAVKKFQDNWMCDETWVRVITARYPDVINSIGFSRSSFNRVISMLASQCGTQNALGIFIHQFQMSCPYDSGQRRKVSYFYRQIIGKPPADPVSVRDITDVHAGRILVTSASPDRGTGGRVITTTDYDDRVDNATKATVQNTPMRAALNNTYVDDSTKTPADITPCRHIDNDDGMANKAEGEQCKSDHDSNVSIYWDSSEAAKLFGFSYKNGDNVYERLKDRIRLLSEVQRSEDGYKRFVSDIEKKPLTTKQTFLFRKKCLYLVLIPRPRPATLFSFDCCLLVVVVVIVFVVHCPHPPLPCYPHHPHPHPHHLVPHCSLSSSSSHILVVSSSRVLVFF